jgi:hypothetical protein
MHDALPECTNHGRGRLEEEPRQYYRALMQGAHAMYRSSVEKSTKRTYKTAERRWIQLTKRIGTHKEPRTASWGPQLC